MSVCQRRFPCPKCGGDTIVSGGPAIRRGRLVFRRRTCRKCGHVGMTFECWVQSETDVTLVEALQDVAIASVILERLPSKRAARQLPLRRRALRRPRAGVTRQQCAFGW